MTRNKFIILIGTIILCFVGFNNKFPLLTFDSGSYINSGFTKEVPFSGNLLYGLFIVHASWGKSLWLVIITQAFILSLLIYYYFRYFSKYDKSIYYAIGSIFLITFLMSASITVSTISPAIFSSISILACGLLMFAPGLNKRDLIIISILLVISAGMDLAFLVTLVLLVLVSSVFHFAGKENKPAFKRLLITIALLCLSWITVSIIHYTHGSNFNMVKDFRVSLLPHFTNSGLTEAYFSKDCKGSQVGICAYQDSLNITTGAKGMFKNPYLVPEQENAYKTITEDITEQPGFYGKFASTSTSDFLHEIFAVKIEKDTTVSDSAGTMKAIFNWYNDDVRELYTSRQIANNLNWKYLNLSQLAVSLLILVISVAVILFDKKSRYKELILFFLLAYIIHALSNSILYGNIKAQGHVVWLPVISIFLYINNMHDDSRVAGRIKNLLMKIRLKNRT